MLLFSKFLSFYHFLNKHTVFPLWKCVRARNIFLSVFTFPMADCFNNLPCCPKMLKNIFNSFFTLMFFLTVGSYGFHTAILLSNSPHLLKVNEIFKKKIECHLFSNFESVIRSEPAKLITWNLQTKSFF